MVNQNSILIAGVEVISECYEYEAVDSQDISDEDASILLDKTILSSVNIQENDTVEIWRGEVASSEKRIFKGFVNKLVPQTQFINVDAQSRWEELRRSNKLNETFDRNIDVSAGKVSAIAQQIIEDYGFTARVVDSGTTILIDIFEARDMEPTAALEELASKIGYQAYYDHHTDEIVFEPKGNVDSGKTVTAGEYPLMNLPKWVDDFDNYFNIVTIRGAEKLVGLSEWFSGDGAENTFTLTNSPRSVNAVWSGTNDFTVLATRPTDTDLQTGGQDDVTLSFDYKWIENTDKVIFEAGSIPSNDTNNVQIDYTYPEDLPIRIKNAAGISKYDKEFELILNKEDIKFATDVEVLANSLLAELSSLATRTELEIGNELIQDNLVASLDAGKTITVVDTTADKARNRTLVITRIIYRYPMPWDVMRVGDPERDLDSFITTMDERLRLVEEKNKNVEALNQLIQYDENVEIRDIYETYTADPDADTLYWDSDDQGTWGNDAGTTGFDWGDDSEETQTLARRVHGLGNVYYEDFREDDLTDTGNTTATVNTTAHTITFTNGQIWQSKIIFLNSIAYTNIIWDLLNVQSTGLSDLTFYAAADGDSETWEEVTIGQLLTFSTTTVAGIKLKIVAAGNATLTFDNTPVDTSNPWSVIANVGI